MTDLGEVHHILGLRILRNDTKTSIDQAHYVRDILKKNNMYECTPVNTPMEANIKLIPLPANEEGYKVHEYRSIIGALNYAAVLTRPDIATVVGLLARHMQKPGKTHWDALQCILRYLKGTIDYRLVYTNTAHENNRIDLQVYCDSDWAGNLSDRKSMTGYVIMINGTAIGWRSTKQTSVAQSTVEAEYASIATTITEVLWIRSVLRELGFIPTTTTIINADNSGAINIVKNTIIGQQLKHVDIKHSLIRDNVEANTIRVQYCSSESNMADAFMKALPGPRFIECRAEMDIKKIGIT